MKSLKKGRRWKMRKLQEYRGVICAISTFSLLFGLTLPGFAGNSGRSAVKGVNLKNITFTGSKQGQSVGFVDVDGDGISDKLVGAPYAAVAERPGAVLVYQGSASGGFSGTPTMILTGDDNYGVSLANLGDVDGDGKDDFAVGALNGDGPDVSLSGSVTVYQGGRNGNYGRGDLKRSRRAGGQDRQRHAREGGKVIAKLAGEGPMDKFGLSVAPGDLNNDGRQDLIVGAPFHTEDPAVYQGGAVYVFFGPGFTDQVALPATSVNKGLGWSAATGDINGDGIADLCLSASGKVLCYYGADDFAPATDSPDVTIKSASKGFGRALAVADVSGDGVGDIAIGAPNAVIAGDRDTGSLYVVQGGAGLTTVSVDVPSPELLAHIDGAALFNRFGASIAAVDDGENGQAAALAIGAPMADLDVLHHLTGKVYVFSADGLSTTATLTDATVFTGFTRNQGYGTALAVDDAARLLCGAPRTDRDTGWVSMVDLATGEPVPGGSSGGATGSVGY
jgi:hypothetical protein